nr:putative G3BP-like protein [Tanacetum cinerariifolium]
MVLVAQYSCKSKIFGGETKTPTVKQVAQLPPVSYVPEPITQVPQESYNNEEGCWVCFAFVEFEDLEGVQKAIKASPIQLAGRQVYIEERRENNSGASRGGSKRVSGHARGSTVDSSFSGLNEKDRSLVAEQQNTSAGLYKYVSLGSKSSGSSGYN